MFMTSREGNSGICAYHRRVRQQTTIFLRALPRVMFARCTLPLLSHGDGVHRRLEDNGLFAAVCSSSQPEPDATRASAENIVLRFDDMPAAVEREVCYFYSPTSASDRSILLSMLLSFRSAKARQFISFMSCSTRRLCEGI